jgi:hypothetical protein
VAFPAVGQDFSLDPVITEEQFSQFASIVGQSIYATPVEPASARGLLAFDIGVAAVGVPIDEEAAYWVNAVDSDILNSGYLVVPRVVVSKGISVANLSASYARVPDTDVEIWGGAVDVPLIGGSLVTPSLSLRAAYSEIRGIEEVDMRTYGAEVFLSKAFGPITPYGAVGMARTDAEGRVPATELTPARILSTQNDDERLTVGLRISLLFPKIVVEATQGEERTYAAKVSFGL